MLDNKRNKTIFQLMAVKLYPCIVQKMGDVETCEWYEKRLRQMRLFHLPDQARAKLDVDLITMCISALCLGSLVTLLILSGVLHDPLLMIYVFMGMGVYTLVPEIVRKRSSARFLRNLERDLPSFFQQLALLVNAGLSLKKSFKELGTCNQSYEISQMIQLIRREQQKGVPLYQAFMLWSHLAPSRVVNRFVVIMTQSLRHGLREVAKQLLQLAEEASREKQMNVKQSAEQLSTKMLFPMILSMMVLLFILVYPIIVQFETF